jgi:hypothetical protein
VFRVRFNALVMFTTKSSNILPTSNIRLLSYSSLVTMKKTIDLMAAFLAAATVIAAGLVLLPGQVQEAQANPCSGISTSVLTGDSDTECLFAGDIEITEGVANGGG